MSNTSINLDIFCNSLLIQRDVLNKFLLWYEKITENDIKYIKNYGLIMLLRLDYNTYFDLDNYTKFTKLFKFIINDITNNNILNNIYSHMVNSVYTCNITIDGINNLLEIDFIYDNEINFIKENIEKAEFSKLFETKTLLGILLRNDISNLELFEQNRLNIKNGVRKICKKYINKIFNNDVDLLYKLFNSIYEYNISKSNLSRELYYTDNLSTFNFIENIISQLLSLVKRNNLEWNNLVYGYYTIFYYNLLIQIWNCNTLLILNGNNSIVNEYIKKNKIHFEYKYNMDRLHKFMFKYITIDILNKETNFHQILNYYNYFYKHIEINYELLVNLVLNNQNPHIKMQCVDILYKLDKNRCYDNIFYNNLVELVIQIDSLKGLHDITEKFSSQLSIIQILLYNNYTSNNKNFYIILFSQYILILDWLISSITENYMKNISNINIELLDTKLTYYDNLLNNYCNFLVYILKSVDNLELYNNKDLLYHLVKFIYGIFKKLYGKDSFKIKINYNPNNIDSNFFRLFKKYVLDKIDLNKLINLSNFKNLITQYYSDIKSYIEIYDVEYGYTYSDKILVDLDVDNLPDEFLDPLLFTPIRDPIILPSSKIIVDKTVIMAYLLENKNHCDPFNRANLTLEELEEYNKLEDVINKCNDFIKRRDNYIIENI